MSIVRTSRTPQGTLSRRRFPAPFASQSSNEKKPTLPAMSQDPAVILRAAFNSTRGGDKIRDLFNGRHGYRDHQHAAYVLARQLAYWTGSDVALLERIILGSPLAKLAGWTGTKSWWKSRGHNTRKGVERCILPALFRRQRFWCDALFPVGYTPHLTSRARQDATQPGQENDPPQTLLQGFVLQESEPAKPDRFLQAVRESQFVTVAAPAGLGEKAAEAFRILHALSGGKPGAFFHVGTVQLGAALNCTRQHAGKILHQLEAANLIRRVATGNNLIEKVSSFTWIGTPAKAAARPQQESPVTVFEAVAAVADGTAPPNLHHLQADKLDVQKLRAVAAVAWHLAGRRSGGSFELKAGDLSPLIACEPNVVGWLLKELERRRVIKRTQKRNNGRGQVPRFTWLGIPSGDATAR